MSQPTNERSNKQTKREKFHSGKMEDMNELEPLGLYIASVWSNNVENKNNEKENKNTCGKCHICNKALNGICCVCVREGPAHIQKHTSSHK